MPWNPLEHLENLVHQLLFICNRLIFANRFDDFFRSVNVFAIEIGKRCRAFWVGAEEQLVADSLWRELGGGWPKWRQIYQNIIWSEWINQPNHSHSNKSVTWNGIFFQCSQVSTIKLYGAWLGVVDVLGNWKRYTTPCLGLFTSFACLSNSLKTPNGPKKPLKIFHAFWISFEICQIIHLLILPPTRSTKFEESSRNKRGQAKEKGRGKRQNIKKNGNGEKSGKKGRWNSF